MMKHTSALLLAGFATLGGSVTAAPDLSKLPPPAQRPGVTYDKDIRPIFEASCFRCHGADRPKNGLRLDSVEAALKGGKDGKVITPGTSEKSKLVIAVARLDEETAMPPKPRQGRPRRGPEGQGNPPPNAGGDGKAPPRADGGMTPPPGGPGGPRGGFGPPPKPLTTEQVALIRAWVDQGAK